jgi:hypothetical protein
MALRHDITANDLWFRGEDKRVRLTVYTSQAKTAILDVSGFALSWQLAPKIGGAPTVTKTTVDGISIVGIFNADPTLNTQYIEVAIADTDTDGQQRLDGWHELKRTDAGLEGVLVHGKATLLAPVHAS